MPAEKPQAATRDELVALLVAAHNALGDCICRVGMRPDVQGLIERMDAALELEDSVYAADE